MGKARMSKRTKKPAEPKKPESSVPVRKIKLTPKSKIFQTADHISKGKASKTADGFQNFASRVGLNNDNELSESFYAFNLLTRNRIQLEAAYRGSWIVGKVIDCIPEDMTRAGIDISTNESDADIKDLQQAITRFQIWQSIQDFIKWSRLYGGAIAVLQIKGQKLDTELNLDSIDKGQFEGLVVYDRWQLNPVLQDVIQSGPEMGLPKYYDIVNNPTQLEPSSKTATGQLKVHHSRVIRGIGIQLPYFQAITEMMWGESVLERLWDRLISFDNATMSCANLIDRANLRTVGINGLREVVGAGGEALAGLVAQMDMMRLAQDNEGLTLIDKEDEFQATAYSFAGLSDMMLQFGQQLSGASDIPLVRLFGQSPAGLSATGESDIRMYYDGVNAQQEAKLRRGMDVILKVLWRSVYGVAAPKDLEFTFTPLWQMDATDKANVAKTNAETILGAHEAGLTDRATSMKELRQMSGDTGLFTNITDDSIEEAENEEPPMPDAPDENPAQENGPEKEDSEAAGASGEVDKKESKDGAVSKMKSWLKGKKK